MATWGKKSFISSSASCPPSTAANEEIWKHWSREHKRMIFADLPSLVSQLTLLYSSNHLPRDVPGTAEWALLQRWRIKNIFMTDFNSPAKWRQFFNWGSFLLKVSSWHLNPTLTLYLCFTWKINPHITSFIKVHIPNNRDCTYTIPPKEKVYKTENSENVKSGQLLISGPHKFH